MLQNFHFFAFLEFLFSASTEAEAETTNKIFFVLPSLSRHFTLRVSRRLFLLFSFNVFISVFFLSFLKKNVDSPNIQMTSRAH
jgi:hypothetical protein